MPSKLIILEELQNRENKEILDIYEKAETKRLGNIYSSFIKNYPKLEYSIQELIIIYNPARFIKKGNERINLIQKNSKGFQLSTLDEFCSLHKKIFPIQVEVCYKIINCLKQISDKKCIEKIVDGPEIYNVFKIAVPDKEKSEILLGFCKIYSDLLFKLIKQSFILAKMNSHDKNYISKIEKNLAPDEIIELLQKKTLDYKLNELEIIYKEKFKDVVKIRTKTHLDSLLPYNIQYAQSHN